MRTVSKKSVVIAAVLFSGFALLGVKACGSSGSSTPTPSTTTTYEAVMTNNGGTESGAIASSVVVAIPSSPFAIIRSAYAATTTTGTLTLTDGTTVALTGTFSDPTLTLTGGGYTMTGTISGDGLTGTCTETGGDDGAFAGFNSTTNAVTTYCGTWTRPADPAHDCNNDRSGVWNLATSNGVVTGVENRDDGTRVNTLTGTISGDTITITNDGQGGSGSATVTGTTVTGTFVNHKGCPGTWTGTEGCQ